MKNLVMEGNQGIMDFKNFDHIHMIILKVPGCEISWFCIYPIKLVLDVIFFLFSNLDVYNIFYLQEGMYIAFNSWSCQLYHYYPEWVFLLFYSMYLGFISDHRGQPFSHFYILVRCFYTCVSYTVNSEINAMFYYC